MFPYFFLLVGRQCCRTDMLTGPTTIKPRFDNCPLMRVETGIVRLQSAVERLNTTARDLEFSPSGASILNLSSFYNTPPLCVGYFNTSSSDNTPQNYSSLTPPYPIQTEEIRFGDKRGILLHAIVILAKDETLLNGSVVGRSHPTPSTCQISTWCSDLLVVRGSLVSLVSNQARLENGSVWFVPPNDPDGRSIVASQLVTDRIILQGHFERLTVCIYGWPVDLESDERFSASKRLVLFHKFPIFIAFPFFSLDFHHRESLLLFVVNHFLQHFLISTKSILPFSKVNFHSNQIQ